MTKSSTKKLVFTGLCIAIGLLLPQVVKLIPIPNAGSVLLPMHIPVLICGIVCGARFGAISGLILPFITFLLTGMPPLFPIGLSMMLELATYGLVIGLAYQYTNGKIFISLIISMILGRIIYGLASTVLYNMGSIPFGFEAFISGALIVALPGIIIQLILIPFIVRPLTRLITTA